MRKLAFIACLVDMMSTYTPAATVMASTSQPSYQPYSIEYNGKSVLSDKGFVENQTAYMSVPDIVNAVKATDINCAWGNGNLIIGDPLPVDLPRHLNQNAIIYLAGREFASVLVVHLSSQPGGTYLPIWYVMQALSKTGLHNSWNGHQWMIHSSE